MPGICFDLLGLPVLGGRFGPLQMSLTGDCTSVRFLFAFFRANQRYRDVTPTICPVFLRLEDQVPENHLLRLIDQHISFEFVRERLRDSYSETDRPSIDPELLLSILLIGYLYGITSERKLVEELRMHLAWRWFSGLGFNQEIPHHSTFSQ